MLLFIIVAVLINCFVQSAIGENDFKASNLPATESLETLKDMQKYIDDSNQSTENLDSYVFAYSHAQDAAETRPKIRTKRSKPEFIKFELSDAKEPDEMTKELLNRMRQQRTFEFETLKVKPIMNKSDDQMTSSSEKIQRRGDQVVDESTQVFIFNSNGKMVEMTSEMPVGVRKAIEEIILRKRSVSNNPPAKRYTGVVDGTHQNQIENSAGSSYGELPYKLDGDLFKSAINLDFASQIPYIPALFPIRNVPKLSEHAQQPAEFSAPDPEQSPESSASKDANQLKYVHFSKSALVPKAQQIESSQQVDPSQQLEQNEKEDESHLSRVESNYYQLFKPNINIPGSRQTFHETYQAAPNRESMTKILQGIALKTPTEQLHDIAQILKQQSSDHYISADPGENTAPIVFPPATKPDVNDEPSDNFEPSNYVTEPPKDHTPVTEEVTEDATPAPYIRYVPVNSVPMSSPVAVHLAKIHLPPPSSYKEVNMNLKPKFYAAQYYQVDAKKLQYASKYNFGYRIRDFHTGNDFGHMEKRDDDGVTRGQYHTLLPDGRIQNVEYHVDDSGYHAAVTYENAH